jgi:hypothetical protein
MRLISNLLSRSEVINLALVRPENVAKSTDLRQRARKDIFLSEMQSGGK